MRFAFTAHLKPDCGCLKCSTAPCGPRHLKGHCERWQTLWLRDTLPGQGTYSGPRETYGVVHSVTCSFTPLMFDSCLLNVTCSGVRAGKKRRLFQNGGSRRAERVSVLFTAACPHLAQSWCPVNTGEEGNRRREVG